MNNLLMNAFLAQSIADGMGERFEFGHPELAEVRQFINSQTTIHITDDTQMALFGQEAINRSAGNRDWMPEQIKSAYLRWWLTQHKTRSETGLGSLEEMMVRRAPGNQCLKALGQIIEGRTAQTEHGAGCGGVMRLLPFALLYQTHGESVARQVAMESTIITHAHEWAIAASGTYMDIAIYLMNGGDRKLIGIEAKDISEIGQGWVADECVAMAAWAVKEARDYDHLLELSITHVGDSDSVAAVAGGLWGLAGLKGFERHIPRLAEYKAVLSVISQ